MIHLITLSGDSAQKFYLDHPLHADFTNLICAVTAGNSLFISTKFRSDLFYVSEKSRNRSILKLWAFYNHSTIHQIVQNDFSFYTGDEVSLTNYFQSLNRLSINWQKYKIYQKAVQRTVSYDPENTLAKKIIGCDHYLTDLACIKRPSLMKSCVEIQNNLEIDNFSIIFDFINRSTNCN